jgi:hypothetical protein
MYKRASYGLDGRGVGVRVPVGSRLFFSPRRPDRFWAPPSFLSNECRGRVVERNAFRSFFIYKKYLLICKINKCTTKVEFVIRNPVIRTIRESEHANALISSDYRGRTVDMPTLVKKNVCPQRSHCKQFAVDISSAFP